VTMKKKRNEEEEEEYVPPIVLKTKFGPKKRCLTKVPRLPDRRDQSAIDEWRATVREQFSMEELEYSDICKILRGFDIAIHDYKSMNKWRLQRLWDGKPNVKMTGAILGASFTRPKQTQIRWENRPFGEGFNNVFDNIIVKKLNLSDLFNLLFTCTYLYCRIHPILTKLAVTKYGAKYGTPMVLSCNLYLEWLTLHGLLPVTRIRERLGFKSTDKQPQLTEEMLQRVGYVEYLKDNELLMFEQIRVKSEDTVQIERTKCNNLAKFNRLLRDAELGFLSVEYVKGNELEFKNKIFEVNPLRGLCFIIIQHGKEYISEKVEFDYFLIEKNHRKILQEFSIIYLPSQFGNRLFVNFIECRLKIAKQCPELYKDMKPVNPSILSIIRVIQDESVILVIFLGSPYHTSTIIGYDGACTVGQIFTHINRRNNYEFVHASIPHFIVVKKNDKGYEK